MWCGAEMRKIVSILGIPIDDLNTLEVLDRLEEFIAQGRFHQVATANVDFLVKAHDDPELKRILRTADLVVPDGMPLVWASKWMRNGLRERVTGADLIFPLAARAAKKGYRVFMLGGESQVAQEAKARLESLNHGLQIVGCESPDVPSLVTTDCTALLQRIEDAKPDILLVAFGNPKQEKFIHMHRDRLRAPVCIGVGGTFDFIAGKTRRAPRVVQKLGLEFLHRWSHNPKRLGSRYMQNLAQFPPLICRQIRVIRSARPTAELVVASRDEGGCTVLAPTGVLSRHHLEPFVEPVDRAFSAGRHVVLDMARVAAVDGFGIGALQNLWKRAAWSRCELRLANVNGRIRRTLEVTDSLALFRIFDSTAEAIRADPAVYFNVCISAEAQGMTVAVCGSVSVEHAEELTTTLADASSFRSLVCLDLREVTYIDTLGLFALRRFADNRKANDLITTSALSREVAQAMARQRLHSLT
jgi:N-acetylglucosaminyldiphosphoundecaprenol N-acetyl-beta-D-mannosaminyltransferase